MTCLGEDCTCCRNRSLHPYTQTNGRLSAKAVVGIVWRRIVANAGLKSYALDTTSRQCLRREE